MLSSTYSSFIKFKDFNIENRQSNHQKDHNEGRRRCKRRVGGERWSYSGLFSNYWTRSGLSMTNGMESHYISQRVAFFLFLLIGFHKRTLQTLNNQTNSERVQKRSNQTTKTYNSKHHFLSLSWTFSATKQKGNFLYFLIFKYIHNF